MLYIKVLFAHSICCLNSRASFFDFYYFSLIDVSGWLKVVLFTNTFLRILLHANQYPA